MKNPLEYVKKEPYKLYIDGEFVPSQSGRTMDVLNPVNNEPFAKAYVGGKADVEKAILAARRAFDEGPWGKMTAKERSKLIMKAGRILESRREEFAVLETLEAGKLYNSCYYFEGDMAVDAFEYWAGVARTVEGKMIPCNERGAWNCVLYQPLGVVGEILPWNGPFLMGCQKINSILAAGNTVIIKPATWACTTMSLLAEVYHEAGFPNGVVNVVMGPGEECGNALVESPLVDMVSMTGGTETGRKIIKKSADTVKDIALELGGKSPNIFFDDVDVDKAVEWARYGFTLHAGQVCVSGSRLIVHKNIYEEFIAKLKKEVEKFVPGDGFDPNTTLNALISRSHYNSVWNYIEKGKQEGARLVTGGVPYTDPALAKGNFVPPTIFADVTPEMTIFQEEIFGPVVTVTPFETEEEAIALANSTIYGLAGGVNTNDIKRALRVVSAVRGGQIYVNTYFSKAMHESPGTGWKQSGLGIAGIHKYMIQKTVFFDTVDGSVPPVRL